MKIKSVKMSKNSEFITFQEVSKDYKDIRALDNVSFHIQKGEIFGYIGPNGAGKTTTMKILVGLIKNYQGRILFNNEDIVKNQSRVHRMLGYLPQEVGFQEWRTIDHALKTFGRLSGLQSDYLEDRISTVLKQVGLLDVRYKKIAHLSGGMVQKLRLAQALLHDPEFLVLDEPMSGLDPTSRYQIKNIITTLSKNKETTIFLSSHILSDVQDIADRIGIINFGRILKIGSPNDLQNEFQIGNVLAFEVAEGSPQCKNLEKNECVDYVENKKKNVQIIHLKTNIDVDFCIHQIINEYLEQKCLIRHFNLVKPSLEEVYLKYMEGEIK